jgi:hypothetical protein
MLDHEIFGSMALALKQSELSQSVSEMGGAKRLQLFSANLMFTPVIRCDDLSETLSVDGLHISPVSFLPSASIQCSGASGPE